MNDTNENFSHTPRSSRQRSEGALIDFNTGALRRNHVLIQRTPGVELFIGLGPVAGAALDFAFGKTFEPSSFLAQCDAIDQAIENGEVTEAQPFGFGTRLADIREPHLRRLALLEAMLEKASVDDPVHPGYPAGTEGGKGGQFRPKDTSAEAKETTEQELKRLKALREFRAAAQAALVLLRTAPLEEIPGVDVVASIEAVAELGRIAIELGNDENEINKAIDFVKHGPYTLDQLRVDENDGGFSSFDAFKKTSLVELFLRRYPGEAGEEYHHIVEQGGANEDNFPAKELHSTQNIIPLPGPIHDLVSAKYSQQYDKTTMTVRQWQQTQSFAEQYKYGLEVLRDLGILK